MTKELDKIQRKSGDVTTELDVVKSAYTNLGIFAVAARRQAAAAITAAEKTIPPVNTKETQNPLAVRSAWGAVAPAPAPAPAAVAPAVVPVPAAAPAANVRGSLFTLNPLRPVGAPQTLGSQQTTNKRGKRGSVISNPLTVAQAAAAAPAAAAPAAAAPAIAAALQRSASPPPAPGVVATTNPSRLGPNSKFVHNALEAAKPGRGKQLLEALNRSGSELTPGATYDTLSPVSPESLTVAQTSPLSRAGLGQALGSPPQERQGLSAQTVQNPLRSGAPGPPPVPSQRPKSGLLFANHWDNLTTGVRGVAQGQRFFNPLTSVFGRGGTRRKPRRRGSIKKKPARVTKKRRKYATRKRQRYRR